MDKRRFAARIRSDNGINLLDCRQTIFQNAVSIFVCYKLKIMLKVTLKRIDVFSVVKWHGLTGLISGFLIGAIYFGIAFYSLGQAALHNGFYYLVGVPLIYFTVTIAGSLIGGILYNALSDSLGGMKFEFESEDEEKHLPPAPPETWTS